jgi:hypothetical protein
VPNAEIPDLMKIQMIRSSGGRGDCRFFSSVIKIAPAALPRQS